MQRVQIVKAVVATAAVLLGVVIGVLAVGLDVLPDVGGATSAAATSAPAVPDRCDDSEVLTLNVAAAPEIASAVREVAEHAGELDESMECTHIDVAAVAPAGVSAALGRGWTTSDDGPPPQVWIPTMSTEVDLARSDIADLLTDEMPSLARSPQVIAMPEPMADTLGWPDDDLNWQDVAQLVSEDDAWAARDHPDWGPFRLSLVNGIRSGPSIDAVTALANAVGAVPGPDTADQSDEQRFQAQAQLLLLERRVAYLGDTAADELDGLRAADDAGELLQTTSAIPLTEQMVQRYNAGDGSQELPDTPLAVWYPKDGGPDADYPYVRIDGSWSTPDTTSAADAFLTVLQSEEGQQDLRANGFRDESRDATPELIDTKGIRPQLAGPAPDPPLALVTAAVTDAWRSLGTKDNVLAVIDVSGSMDTEVPGTGETRLALSGQGITGGAALLDPASHGGLWEFSTDLDGGKDYRELISMGPLGEVISGGKTRTALQVEAVRDLQPRADTGLYDTILASYQHVLDNYQPDMLNAVVLFTDGKNDDDDGISLQELERRLRDVVDPNREVLFVGVGYGPEADFDTLGAVAEITGGKLYEPERPEDIRNVFIDVVTGNVR